MTFTKLLKQHKRMTYAEIVKELDEMDLPKSGANDFTYVTDIAYSIECVKAFTERALKRKSMKIARVHKNTLLKIYLIVKFYPQNHNIKREEYMKGKYMFKRT